jgi:hypothetical protein
MWDDILPRVPEYQWHENLALVAAWLAEFGGTALAEPPRIDWQSPATLSHDEEEPEVGASPTGDPGTHDDAPSTIHVKHHDADATDAAGPERVNPSGAAVARGAKER